MTTSLMTAEEFLRLRDDGIDRDLIDGEVRKRGPAIRDRRHSFVEAQIAFTLEHWRRIQKPPCGTVHGNGAGILLARNPDTLVGVDVGYFPPEVTGRERQCTALMDGPPVLAVEILSPSDLQEVIVDKVRKYLLAGVAVVWVVDPNFETVTVYRNDIAPQMFNNEQELAGEPFLPGLKIPVASFFRKE
jgi:Uma2 family endonuclease